MSPLEYNIPSLLYKYLACKGSVNIPGIGTLQLKRKPALNIFSEKRVDAFEFQFIFNSIALPPPSDQLHFLERYCSISKSEIMDLLESLKSETIQKINSDRKLEWIGVGLFLKDESDRLVFQPKLQTIEYYPSISYQHVLRESASHAVLVGESERSSEEMETYFEERKRGVGSSKWAIPALVLAILALLIVFIRFSFGNFNLSEGRYNSLHPTLPPATYSTQ
jgi:hypothetical protein